MSDWRFVEADRSNRTTGEVAETRAKLSRLRQAMAENSLDAVYLERWNNVAWLCGGRGNRVVLDSDRGLCGVLVGANGAWLLLPNNEEARCRSEVFADLALPVLVRAWYQLPLWQSVLGHLPAGAQWAADVAAEGALDVEPMIAPLRRSLVEADQERYRALGTDAAEALESALLETGPEWRELHVAAAIEAELKARDVEAAVVLVGGARRAERYRHLVPVSEPVGDGVVASITATRHGLHASVTRSLSYGPPAERRRQRHHAAVAVDSAYLHASRPGASLGDILALGESAYEDAGYYDDWKEHHQGGTTGYAGRELFALPGSTERLAVGNALAWNPTVPGAKSEDTVLVREDGLELLTQAPGSRWPVIYADGESPVPRTGLLVL